MDNLKTTVYKMMIREITRKELYDMSTSQLIELDGKCCLLAEKIKSELICRGDY